MLNLIIFYESLPDTLEKKRKKVTVKRPLSKTRGQNGQYEQKDQEMEEIKENETNTAELSEIIQKYDQGVLVGDEWVYTYVSIADPSNTITLKNFQNFHLIQMVNDFLKNFQICLKVSFSLSLQFCFRACIYFKYSWVLESF